MCVPDGTYIGFTPVIYSFIHPFIYFCIYSIRQLKGLFDQIILQTFKPIWVLLQGINKGTPIIQILKGPTLSPAYPRIGYITLSCQSQLTCLNCFWSAKPEMHEHRGDYRKMGAEVL